MCRTSLLCVCLILYILLREEVEEAIKSEGWTKAGLDQMHKLDSFIKESLPCDCILS
jgi:hypothetical protein